MHPAVPRHPSGVAGDRATTPRHVLVVDDEPSVRRLLNDLLTSEGYLVETASDGRDGLERAASAAYDVIVLDVMLPRMNGFDLCREVRRRGVDAPILMRAVFVPINIITEIAKPISLALRLFGNIFGGVVVVYLLTLAFRYFATLGGPVTSVSVIWVVLLAAWKVFDVFVIAQGVK